MRRNRVEHQVYQIVRGLGDLPQVVANQQAVVEHVAEVHGCDGGDDDALLWVAEVGDEVVFVGGEGGGGGFMLADGVDDVFDGLDKGAHLLDLGGEDVEVFGLLDVRAEGEHVHLDVADDVEVGGLHGDGHVDDDIDDGLEEERSVAGLAEDGGGGGQAGEDGDLDVVGGGFEEGNDGVVGGQEEGDLLGGDGEVARAQGGALFHELGARGVGAGVVAVDGAQGGEEGCGGGLRGVAGAGGGGAVFDGCVGGAGGRCHGEAAEEVGHGGVWGDAGSGGFRGVVKVDELLEGEDDEGVVLVPVGLGAAAGVHEVLDGEAVQLLVLAEGLDDVPAEAVDVDPPALHPAGLRHLEELDEAVVVELLDVELVRGEVDDGDLALGVGLDHCRVAAVGPRRVDAGLRAGPPSVPRFKVVQVLDGLHRAGAHGEAYPPSMPRWLVVVMRRVWAGSRIGAPIDRRPGVHDAN